MINKEDFKILQGNALDVLKTLPDKSVQMCVTSPPYYNLRDYGTATWVGGDPNCNHYRDSKYSENCATGHKYMMEHGEAVGDAIYKTVCPKCGAVRIDEQIGLEETPDEYIQRLVEVFREVKRVLKDDGTLWINIGDTYNGTKIGKTDAKTYGTVNEECAEINKQCWQGAKNKDLLGIPWQLAFALRKPYYTGVVKNITDRVWLASMMDAEGSFCLSQYNYRGKPKINLYISMTNSSEKIINKFDALFPQEIKHVYAKSGVVRKQVYRIDIEQLEKKEQFICEIFPHIVEKRKQCIVAYTFLQLQKGMPNKKYGYTDEQSEKRTELVELMHKLNVGEDVVLPKYCVEPRSLYEDGFYLRQDIIWDKSGNAMPESVTDRCTKAHEYIFLLSKSPKYLFNYDAIKEPVKEVSLKRAQYGWHGKGIDNTGNYAGLGQLEDGEMLGRMVHEDGRHKRDVWHINTNSYSGAHFATYPEELVLPCILAGSNEGDIVLDVFNGAATTGIVAIKNNRKYIGIELNPKYVKLSEERFNSVFNGLEPLSEPVISEGMRKTDLLEDI